jgi:hypothetical protein
MLQHSIMLGARRSVTCCAAPAPEPGTLPLLTGKAGVGELVPQAPGMLESGIDVRCVMRMLLAVIVLVSLAGVVEAQAPIIIGPNGLYLGNLSANPNDPNSVANPYGRFGSRFSPDSINNPYGQWGSPYSPNSAVTNPFSTRGPRVMQPNRPMMPPGW